MKKVLSLFLVIVTVSLVFFSVGCDRKSDDVEYYNYGLHYKLPKEYKKITVTYSEFTYYNSKGAYFYFNTMSEEKLVENNLAPDISVEDYARNFIALNGITSPLSYDKESNTALIEYVYDYSDDEVKLAPEFYYHYILRGSQLLYIVTMSCAAENADEYKPAFKDFMKDIRAE